MSETITSVQPPSEQAGSTFSTKSDKETIRKKKKTSYCCQSLDEYNGSQAWFTVGLVFLSNFLILGFCKSLGVLTKILKREFDTTMHVYILMCIMYSLNCAAAPLACYLTRIYSARSVALVGTSLVSFGLILSWFANSLTFLYFSLGVFAGVGSGLSYPTGVILVGNYFVGTKRAGLANALIVSGSPIGGMIMPYIISVLCDMYTTRGAFLISGGVMLHAIICVRSYRSPPPPNNTESGRIIRTSLNDLESGADMPTCGGCGNPTMPLNSTEGNNNEQDSDINQNLVVIDDAKIPQKRLGNSYSTGILKLFERDQSLECRKRVSGFSLESQFRPNKPAPVEKPENVKEFQTESINLHNLNETREEVNPTGAAVAVENKDLNVFLHQFENLCEKCREDNRKVISLQGLDFYRKTEISLYSRSVSQSDLNGNTEAVVDQFLMKRVCLTASGTGSHPYILVLDHSCIILCSKTDMIITEKPKESSSLNNLYESETFISSLAQSAGDALTGNDDNAENRDGDAFTQQIDNGASGSFMRRLKSSISSSPLRDRIYVLLLISNCSTAISTTNIHLMISQLDVIDDSNSDYSKTSIVYLLIAFADLSGRLLGAFLSDKGILTPSHIYGMGLILSGICSSVFATLASYTHLCILSLLFGLFSGFQVGVYGLLLTDIVGRGQIHMGYGISMLLNGTLQLFAILIMGNMISTYKDGFSWLVPLLGCTLVAGGIVWSIGRIIICTREAARAEVTPPQNENANDLEHIQDNSGMS